MAFIVTEKCIQCKIGDCVEVCPVDCFYEGKNMLVINPDECIDCGLCESECPINAIYSEKNIPKDQIKFVQLNKQLANKWNNITEKCKPLPHAEDWYNVENKIKYLIK